jgi:hypothetical protein
MPIAARTWFVLAAISFLPGCAQRGGAPRAPVAPVLGTLAPSPRLIVGRIVAADLPRRFAFVELAADAPTAATADGSELVTRTADLTETARLRGSRYLRGRTLGTTIVSGQPAPGDEVVWLAP